MTHVNIHEAKARFSALARKVKSGETIILCERNRPIAEIRPLRPGGKPGERRFGLMPGSVRMDKEFFAEDAAITAEFERVKNRRRRGR